jgi:hypothetical protein
MRALGSLVCRVLFLASFVLAGLAVGEKLANQAGFTVLRSSMGAGRLLEIAAIGLLFVIALQLRDISHSLRSKPPS